MRILYLNYEFPPLGGGASPVSYEIAKGYVKRGHEVDVVTMSYRGLPEYEQSDGINIYRVACLRSRKEICHPWEQLTYILSAKRFLSKRLGTTSYSINHTHFIIPTGAVALWLKKKYGIPYIVTAHGSDVLGYNRRFRPLYPFLRRPWMSIVRNAKYVTAPSDFLVGKIREIAGPGRYETVANGLDLAAFRPGEKENRILVVARLFPNKGVQDVIEALRGMDLGGWSVDIVGDGPSREMLTGMIRTYGLSGTVRMHGWIDNASDRMKELYGKARIFISASRFESFGLTVLEAVSAGCYPLVSDIEGHRFIIDDDRHFFQKSNVADLRGKLAALVSKGTCPFDLDIGRFDWGRVIRDYISLLEG
jgi:glycosyltransferase involved in cell wall biosynthesis